MFLTIAAGYLIGEISIKGFSLGVGAVLFVALGVGWFAPQSAPAAILGNFGLALFLYAVGIHYGREFFDGLTSAQGLKANLLALIGVLCAGGISLLLVHWGRLDVGYALGLFAGSGTSTPTLQAAITAMDNDSPAVGYSIAYPFGVAGPILLLYLTFALLKPNVESPVGGGMELIEVSLQKPAFFGRRLGDFMGELPSDARIVAIRRDQRNRPADANTILAENDVLLVVAPAGGSLDEVRQRLGEVTAGHFTQDRRDLDYLRVFASRPSVVGKMLRDLQLPGEKSAAIAHVRRGDTEVLPGPDLVLEYGDRIGLLAHRDDFSTLRTFFGDSIKGTAEFSYPSIGLGMALGMILGAIPIPLPGMGTIQLGLSGVLIVALVFGRQRRTARLNWALPLSSNLVLRNLGLTIFLAQVGMASGPRFASAIAETGLIMLGMGAVVLVGLIVPILLLGLFVFKIPYDDLVGIVSGACGNAAILSYANKQVPNDRPDIGYAMIFPGMTIVKILFVSIVPAFL